MTRHGIDWANYHSTSPARLVASRLIGRGGRQVIAKLAPTARRRPGAVLHELVSKLQFTADVFAISALVHLRHVHGMKRFFIDAATGRLPAFSIVDPSFVDFSEEPPQDILLGERFAATVIDAVMRSPAWPSTLLVWCYDEHGGYYDHVPPPPAIEPDDVRPRIDDPDARYDRYGFRVPAVIVSPYARPGAVLHDVFDHTSVLRLLEDVWNLPSLTRRDAAATSPIGALDLRARRRRSSARPRWPRRRWAWRRRRTDSPSCHDAEPADAKRHSAGGLVLAGSQRQVREERRLCLPMEDAPSDRVAVAGAAANDPVREHQPEREANDGAQREVEHQAP